MAKISASTGAGLTCEMDGDSSDARQRADLIEAALLAVEDACAGSFAASPEAVLIDAILW